MQIAFQCARRAWSGSRVGPCGKGSQQGGKRLDTPPRPVYLCLFPRAGVTQLVEYKLPKLGVAGSNPVARSRVALRHRATSGRRRLLPEQSARSAFPRSARPRLQIAARHRAAAHDQRHGPRRRRRTAPPAALFQGLVVSWSQGLAAPVLRRPCTLPEGHGRQERSRKRAADVARRRHSARRCGTGVVSGAAASSIRGWAFRVPPFLLANAPCAPARKAQPFTL